MRKILLAGVALLALGGVAQADPSFQPGNPHQPPVSPPPPPPPPTPDVDNSPLMVVDAAGQTVGFYDGGYAIVNVAAPGAPSFLVQVTGVRQQGFSTGGRVSPALTNYLYPTHDCSGPAYLTGGGLPPVAYIVDANNTITNNNGEDPERYSGPATIAYPLPPYKVFDVWSSWRQNGVGPTFVQCDDVAAVQSIPNPSYGGLAATHTLSFTAPFHVE